MMYFSCHKIENQTLLNTCRRKQKCRRKKRNVSVKRKNKKAVRYWHTVRLMVHVAHIQVSAMYSDSFHNASKIMLFCDNLHLF